VIREEQLFERIDFHEKSLIGGEYDNCRFVDCNLSNADLSECKFLECEFERCDLSLVRIHKTAWVEATFTECKMLGLQFESCHQIGLSFSFDKCSLNHCSFYQTVIRKTQFAHSQLHEVDFTECDLTESIFNSCDLAGAKFENTILEKADLGTSFHYSVDPEINRIRHAKFSLPHVTGLLEKYDIVIDHNS